MCTNQVMESYSTETCPSAKLIHADQDAHPSSYSYKSFQSMYLLNVDIILASTTSGSSFHKFILKSCLDFY